MPLPTAMVSTTRVPGLLAALGPVAAGLVYLGLVAVGEATWRGPTGPDRAANLARRPRYSRARRWASRALAAWATLLALCVLVFGALAGPDGRCSHRGSADGCVVDSVRVPCDSAVVGPFPGWAYGGPIALGAAALLVVSRRRTGTMVAPGGSRGDDTVQAAVGALVTLARRSGISDADLLALVRGALLDATPPPVAAHPTTPR